MNAGELLAVHEGIVQRLAVLAVHMAEESRVQRSAVLAVHDAEDLDLSSAWAREAAAVDVALQGT